MTTTRKPAVAHEALAEPISFDYDGNTYTVPPTSDWEYDALDALDQGRIPTFLRLTLGVEQHDAFKSTRPKASAVGEFMDALQTAAGISGN